MASLDKNTTQSFDEIEDLTRFADESFDTDEINLFEFSDQENSPLTRLKSVILSLDWEITDDILDELFEEVDNQKSQREGDKVAQIYLQALEKVGKYLKAEGAYAHPNAIKLLLTLYYNYEKILSSPDISSEEITLLLKSDIRKFKVLQFQIGIEDKASVQTIEEVVGTTEKKTEAEEACEFLDCIHATILGLEWEVTDEGLEKFNRQADQLREDLLENKAAQILVLGLQVLGAYISEEKAQAHPDAFTLLHSFYEGLKILALEENLDSKQRQEILIDKVSRLNNLKEIIAQKRSQEPYEAPDDEIDQILDFEDTETQADDEEETITVPPEDSLTEDDALQLVSDEEDVEEDREGEPAEEQDDAESFLDEEIQKSTYPVGAAMETAVDKYPEDILEPDAIQPVSDTIADDLIEEELAMSSSETFSSEFAEISGESEDDFQDTLDTEEQLELLFSDVEEEEQKPDSDSESLDDVFDALELDFEEEKTTPVDMSTMGQDTSDISEHSEEVSAEIPDFGEDLFLDSEENDNQETQKDNESVELALDDIEEDPELNKDVSLDLDDKLDDLFGSVDEEPSRDENPTNLDDISPALADTDSEDGFNEELTAAEIGDDSSEELQEKLDSLFGSSDEDSTVFLEEELDSLFTDDEEQETEKQANEPSAALAGVEGETGFNEELTAAEIGDDSSEELQEKLDSLFGSSDAEAESNLEEEPDFLFIDDEAENTDDLDLELTPLAEDAEQIEFEEEISVSDADDSAQNTSDDGSLDAFLEEDEAQVPHDLAMGITIIASLVTAAEAVTATPEPENIEQISPLVAKGKEENPSPQQKVLLTLIDAAATLLSQNPEAAVERSAIVQELIAGFEDSENPATLAEAVSRYTSWQLDFFTVCMSTRENGSPASSSPPADDTIISKVELGFSQLREVMLQEFDTLKKELKKE